MKNKNFYFKKANYYILIVALVFITIGYILMWLGSTNISTVLLVLGYIVLVPISILYKKTKRPNKKGLS